MVQDFEPSRARKRELLPVKGLKLDVKTDYAESRDARFRWASPESKIALIKARGE